jgi:LPXTG-motif cell wall-anchored protein
MVNSSAVLAEETHAPNARNEVSTSAMPSETEMTQENADNPSNYFLNPLPSVTLDGAVTESGENGGWETALTDQGTLYIGVPAGAENSNLATVNQVLYTKVSDSNLVKKVVIATPCTLSGIFTGFFSNFHNVVSYENLSALNTSAVTNMSGLFEFNSSLTSLDLTGLDTSSVTNMSWMFTYDSALTSLNVSGFDTSKVEDFYAMFADVTSLQSLDISNFNTSSAKSMEAMFDGASSLESLDLSNFDTSNVEIMYYMFRNTTSLSSLDLSNFNTSKTYGMAYMFTNSGIQILDISSFDTKTIRDSGYIVDTYEMLNIPDLHQLVLGRSFAYTGYEGLVGLTASEKYSGKWENVSSGTLTNPKGSNIWTSEEFMSNYDGSKDADTYVWQPLVPPAATVTVQYLDENVNKIQDDEVLNLTDGDNYTVTRKTIAGYTLDETRLPANESGKVYSDSPLTLTYYYIKDKVKDNDTDNNIDNSDNSDGPMENPIEDSGKGSDNAIQLTTASSEPLPTSTNVENKLPSTGESNPSYAYAGAGSLLLVLSLFIKNKKH